MVQKTRLIFPGINDQAINVIKFLVVRVTRQLNADLPLLSLQLVLSSFFLQSLQEKHFLCHFDPAPLISSAA